MDTPKLDAPTQAMLDSHIDRVIQLAKEKGASPDELRMCVDMAFKIFDPKHQALADAGKCSCPTGVECDYVVGSRITRERLEAFCAERVAEMGVMSANEIDTLFDTLATKGEEDKGRGNGK